MFCGRLRKRKVCGGEDDIILENSPNLKGRSLMSPLKSLQLSPILKATKDEKPTSLKERGKNFTVSQPMTLRERGKSFTVSQPTSLRE